MFRDMCGTREIPVDHARSGVTFCKVMFPQKLHPSYLVVLVVWDMFAIVILQYEYATSYKSYLLDSSCSRAPRHFEDMPFILVL